MAKPGAPALERALWGALILVLVVVVGAGTKSMLRERATARLTLADEPARPPIYGLVPDFSFSERSGRRVERVELLGKIWIVNFIYTHCRDTCPLQGAGMAKLQADLSTEPDLRLVSISVDPARDTPELLSRYAKRFGADQKQWLFLTGEREAIHRFATEGLRLPVIDPGEKVEVGMFEPAPAAAHAERVGAPIVHSSRFVLVDRKARIRGYYESTDRESLLRLRKDVKALLREE